MPNADRAAVPEEKITRYLLNLKHPVGGSKAVYFLGQGFSLDSWEVLRNALLHHVLSHGVAETGPHPHGTPWVVEGPMRTPSGQAIEVRTVWLVRHGEDFPRFVTAYPA